MDHEEIDRIARVIAGSGRPVLVLGSDVWTGGAEFAARQAAEELRLPVITNGQGRGLCPLAMNCSSLGPGRWRSGRRTWSSWSAPRWTSGWATASSAGKTGRLAAQVIHIADAPSHLAGHCPLAGAYAGDLAAFFAALPEAVNATATGTATARTSTATATPAAGPATAPGAGTATGPGAAPARVGAAPARVGAAPARVGAAPARVGAAPARAGAAPARVGAARVRHRAWEETWLPRLQAAVKDAMAADSALLTSAADPIHPMRIYGELAPLLDDDAVVIGDGGDFVSYAGKYTEPRRPGGWLDPGPYGCLGTGLGYAIAARLARPSAQVVLLLGDGAAGFSLMDADTLVRHKLPVVMICGNNGIWGLEKHPMQAIYGYDVVADLQPECRYDQVVAALGGAGELVTKPGDIGPALRRAFDAGVPYLVNVITDPAIAYPRSTTGI